MTEGPGGDSSAATCPECEAPLAAEARFCDECGASIPRSLRSGPGPAKRSTRGERAEKIEARATIAKARDKVSKIRMLFWLLAVLPSFLGVFGLLGAGPTPMVLGFCAAALLMIAGALFVPRQPYVWTLVLAVVMTLVTIADFWSRGLSIGASIEAFVSFTLWMALPQMKRAAGILAEHGDEFDARHLTRRVTREGVERSGARARSRLRNQKEMGGKMRTVLLIGGLVVVVAVVLGGVLFALGQTESLESRTTLFEQRWAADDLDAVAAMFERERRKSYWPKFENYLGDHGWSDDLPELGDSKMLEESDWRAEVHWQMKPRGTLKVRWQVADSKWRITRIGVAGLR